MLSRVFTKSCDKPQGTKLSGKFITKNNHQITLFLTNTHLYRISPKGQKVVPLTTALRFQIRTQSRCAVLRLEMDDTNPIEYQFSEKIKLWEMLLKQRLPELEYQKKYEIGKLVGNGSFASVYSAISKEDGTRVAIKAFQKRMLFQKDPEWRIQLENEINVMRQLNHPNLLKIYDIFENKAQVHVIIELAKGGTLYQSLKKLESPLPFLAVKVIFKQIVEGVKALHDLGYMHRDLKPGNILFRNPMALKAYALQPYEPNIIISDFGIASQVKQKLDVYQFCGSYGYMAPEIFECEQDNTKTYDQSCDIFSLGCMLYKLITNKPLFNPLQAKQLNKECNIDWNTLSSDLYQSRPLITLLQKMLNKDPKERPTCQQLLQAKILSFELDDEGCPVFQNYQKPRHSTISTARLKTQIQRGSLQQQLGSTQVLRKQYMFGKSNNKLPPLQKQKTEHSLY